MSLLVRIINSTPCKIPSASFFANVSYQSRCFYRSLQSFTYNQSNSVYQISLNQVTLPNPFLRVSGCNSVNVSLGTLDRLLYDPNERNQCFCTSVVLASSGSSRSSMFNKSLCSKVPISACSTERREVDWPVPCYRCSRFGRGNCQAISPLRPKGTVDPFLVGLDVRYPLESTHINRHRARLGDVVV